MPALPKEIADFMEKYGVLASEIWDVRNGVYAIKHKALERIAVENRISFDTPEIIQIDLKEKSVALWVRGGMPGSPARFEWATGEACPYNNKNGYPVAMAEKRAKDRVVLKLLNAHGAIYSEDEADDFKRENPHTTKPEDIYDPPEYDDNGQTVDNIPIGDTTIKPLPKKNAKEIFTACQAEIRGCISQDQLKRWSELNKDRVQQLPPDWAQILRGVYADQRDTLRSKAEMEAA